MFNGYKQIDDLSKSTGFEQYLLLEYDNGHTIEAYGFDDNVLMDIEAMVVEVFRGVLDAEDAAQNITFSQSSGGPNHASIITDSRTPDSVVVWTSTDFYLN